MQVLLYQKRFFIDPVNEDLVNDRVAPVGKKEHDYFSDLLRHDHAFTGQIRTGELYHIGIYSAGTDGMDTDIVPVTFSCQTFGPAQQGMFAGGINTLQRISGM